MNISLSEEISELIRAVPPREWQGFFNQLKQREFQAIGNLEEKQLTALQERVKMLTELERLFTIDARPKNQL